MNGCLAGGRRDFLSLTGACWKTARLTCMLLVPLSMMRVISPVLRCRWKFRSRFRVCLKTSTLMRLQANVSGEWQAAPGTCLTHLGAASC